MSATDLPVTAAIWTAAATLKSERERADQDKKGGGEVSSGLASDPDGPPCETIVLSSSRGSAALT